LFYIEREEWERDRAHEERASEREREREREREGRKRELFEFNRDNLTCIEFH